MPNRKNNRNNNRRTTPKRRSRRSRNNFVGLTRPVNINQSPWRNINVVLMGQITTDKPFLATSRNLGEALLSQIGSVSAGVLLEYRVNSVRVTTNDAPESGKPFKFFLAQSYGLLNSAAKILLISRECYSNNVYPATFNFTWPSAHRQVLFQIPNDINPAILSLMTNYDSAVHPIVNFRLSYRSVTTTPFSAFCSFERMCLKTSPIQEDLCLSEDSSSDDEAILDKTLSTLTL